VAWLSEVLRLETYDAAGRTVISMKLAQSASRDDNGIGRLAAVPIIALPQLSPQLPCTSCAARALRRTVANFMLAKVQRMKIF
jgi:hypothetical protein